MNDLVQTNKTINIFHEQAVCRKGTKTKKAFLINVGNSLVALPEIKNL